jgi:protein TonB
MKIISAYFPFLIISLVFYGYIFIYIDQPKRITTPPLNSGEQSIQVQFISQPDKLEEQPNRQETVVASRPEVAKAVEAQPKKTTKSLMLSESDVKLGKQTLLKSLAQPGSDNEANLKANVFYQKPAMDKIISKEKEQPSKIEKSPEVTLLPPTSSSATKKTVVKKSPSENSTSPISSTENQGVLQEAIVVSGRKPVYPQRAILRSQQGRVVVKLIVTKKGWPKNPKILTSSGFSLLDDAVLAFINQELFMPALQGEDKVISEQFFAFRFELN